MEIVCRRHLRNPFVLYHWCKTYRSASASEGCKKRLPFEHERASKQLFKSAAGEIRAKQLGAFVSFFFGDSHSESEYETVQPKSSKNFLWLCRLRQSQTQSAIRVRLSR
jgi:hypothetical protein